MKPRKTDAASPALACVGLVRREYPCTECAGDATVGFSNWRGPTGQIIGKKERLCSACAKKRRITFSFHAKPNDKDVPRSGKLPRGSERR